LTDPQAQPEPTRPQRLHDGREIDNDLTAIDDPLEEEDEHGRIGYGRFGELTPYGLAILIILTILIIAAVNWVRDDEDNDPAAENQSNPEEIAVTRGPAPGFSVTLVSGEQVDLSAYRGKVVVLNFWATWCGPCKEEMPALQELMIANPDDVVVLGIAGPGDSPDEVISFADDLGVTYPLATDTGGNGPVGEIASSYKVFGYPGTFFINANGDIVDAAFAPVDIDKLQEYVDRARSTT
jgi:thiol-disulfide isomerase/thioredoxin